MSEQGGSLNVVLFIYGFHCKSFNCSLKYIWRLLSSHWLFLGWLRTFPQPQHLPKYSYFGRPRHCCCMENSFLAFRSSHVLHKAVLTNYPRLAKHITFIFYHNSSVVFILVKKNITLLVHFDSFFALRLSQSLLLQFIPAQLCLERWLK